MRKALTEQNVISLKAPKGGRLEVFDRNVPGFGVRVGPRSKSFFCFYRDAQGRNIRLAIGEHVPPALPIDEMQPPLGSLAWAKKRAAFLRGQAKNARIGIEGAEDPRLTRKREKREARDGVPAEETVAGYLERYLRVEAHAKRRTAAAVERSLRQDMVPKIGAMRLSDVTADDIEAIHEAKIDEGHSTQANRVLSYVKHFFKWAAHKAKIENVAKDVKRQTAAEEERKRKLSADELPLFWRACDKIAKPYGDLFKFVLLTAVRRGEASGMTWDELDLARCVWHLPKERSKNKEAADIPLSAAAVAIINAQPRIEGSPLVFSTGKGGELKSWTRVTDELNALCKFRLDDKSDKPGARLTIHDLRRSAANMLDDLGVSYYVRERCLNHKKEKLDRTYSTAELQEQRREAFDKLADFVTGAVQRVV